MNNQVFLIPDGDAVYAIPVDVTQGYALKGDELAAAISVLKEEDDVTGQRDTSSGSIFPPQTIYDNSHKKLHFPTRGSGSVRG
ncbi:hypothetical protein PSEUDO9AZ_40186 [Pseudomonas sp. 9AZ]|uniref:hypothetical protein n=1 Tax=Pseudomonas sp. 9AZ TaxID=2653168 RepID=UPI0012F134E8|nr:hypothetical protein [Pseudomonas sp. 9AZ]VXD00170.1 hypothetical protein PSEUDO9AZ_40186 [Pseudomonas sp. 9AZ]